MYSNAPCQTLTFSHLEICLKSNQSPHHPFCFAIIMLPTFLLGHKRIYSRQTYQYLSAWSKHLLGSLWYRFSVNPHFHLPLLLERSDTELLCALSWNERLDSLQCARHSNCNKTHEFSIVCARAPPIIFVSK